MTSSDLEPERTDATTGPLSGLMVALREDAGLRAISANTLWLIADKLSSLALNVVVSVLVVRYLGPSDFGSFNLAAAVVAIAAAVAHLGLESIIVRELVKEPGARNETLGTAFVLMFAAGAVMIPIAVVVGEWVSDGDARVRTMLGILSLQFLFQSVNVIDYWFCSGMRSKYTVWSSKAGQLANALLCLWLIYVNATVVAFAYAALLETAVISIGLLIYYAATRGRVTEWRFRVSRARLLMAGAIPLVIGRLAGSVYARIDFILLKELLDERAVGIYAAAVRVTELWYFVPTAIMVSLAPSLVRSREFGAAAYARRRQALYDLMAAIGYVIAIPTALLAGPLMTVVFGPAYEEAARVLSIHIWTVVIVSIGVARSNWLVVEHLESVYMWTAIGGAAINVVLDWTLIPRYGVVAAAWASVAAQGFIVFGSSAFSPRLRASFKEIVLALLIPFRWRDLRNAFAEGLRGKL